MCICAYYQGYFLVKTSLKNQGDTSAFFRSRVSKYTDRPKCNVGGCVIICRYLWSPLWRRRTNVYKFQPHLKLKFLSSHSHIGLKRFKIHITWVARIREAIKNQKCSFFNIVQMTFDPPPCFEHICRRFFWRTVKKCANICHNKIIRKSVRKNVKFRKSYPPFGTFLAFNNLTMSVCAAKGPFEFYIIYMIIFEQC